MLRSLSVPFLVVGLLLTIGVHSATSASASAVAPPDRGLLAYSTVDTTTVQLLQLPDPSGEIVPQLGVYYFDVVTQRYYSGIRNLLDGEFMQDKSNASVAPGVEVQLASFDPCTGDFFTLTTTVGPDGLTWAGVGPMMPSTLTLASSTLHVFSKNLTQEAVAAGTLEGDLSVDLGNSLTSQIGRIFQRVVQ